MLINKKKVSLKKKENMLTFQTSGMVLGVLQLCETVLLQSRESNFFSYGTLLAYPTYAVFRIRITFMRIRILLFTLMQNRILPLTFLKIWTLQCYH